MSVNVFSNMVGKTMSSIVGDIGDDCMIFHAEDGSRFVFQHYQDCCESVFIEDICGDLKDLVDVPLIEAEEVSNLDAPEVQAESHTWTFYRFASAKGAVTIRWLGTSNGYYSEGVSFEETCL